MVMVIDIVFYGAEIMLFFSTAGWTVPSVRGLLFTTSDSGETSVPLRQQNGRSRRNYSRFVLFTPGGSAFGLQEIARLIPAILARSPRSQNPSKHMQLANSSICLRVERDYINVVQQALML